MSLVLFLTRNGKTKILTPPSCSGNRICYIDCSMFKDKSIGIHKFTIFLAASEKCS